MKIVAEITALENIADGVRVRAQGGTPNQAEWRAMLSVQFDAPDHIGKRYRIGQKIKVQVS